MKNTAKAIKSLYYRPQSVILLIVLLLVTTATSYVITKMGVASGVMIILGALGAGVAIFMLAYPEFAFYSTIVLSFFIFMILRMMNSELPLVSLIDLMVWLTFIAVLIKKGVKGESLWKNCSSPILLMYLIILFYTGLEYFNPNGGNTELYFLIVRRTASLLLFLYCAVQIFSDMNAMNRFFKIAMILMFLSALYACYEEWFGLPAFELHYITSDPLRQRLAALDGGDNYRKSSFLPSCTDFGMLMAASTTIFLVLYLRLKATKKRKRLFMVGLICSVLAMTYSGTRTATLMLTVEIALYVLMTITEKKTMIFFSIFAFVLIVVIFGPTYGNGTLRRLKSTFDLKSEESLQVRDINRHAIQPYIYSHPIGGGLGTTGVLSISYNVGHPLAGFPTDSGLLAVVLEQGMIGLLIQCLTYFVLLQQAVVFYYKSGDPRGRIMLLSAVLFIFGFVFAQYAQVAIGQLPNGFIYLGWNAVIIRLCQMGKEKLIIDKL